MAGTVLSIKVVKMEKVLVGQEVLILESMKMAIPIESDESGYVSEIKVNIGDFVNEGDVLVILDQ